MMGMRGNGAETGVWTVCRHSPLNRVKRVEAPMRALAGDAFN